MKLKLAAGVLLALTLIPVSPVLAAAPTVGDISSQLVCQCDCNMVLANCACEFQEAMVDQIRQGIDQGQSGPAIVQSFVDQYGEQVLAAPPKRGFNLTAWILPFVVIILGGIAVYFVVKRWVGQGRVEATVPLDQDAKYSQYQQRVDRELAEYKKDGFR